MVRVIAECAQGYLMPDITDSIQLAKWLVKSSKASGADATKFQLVLADELCTPDYKYYELSKNLELGFNGWKEICQLSKKIGLEMIFDVFGIESLKMAENLGVSEVKLHPTDFRNNLLLEKVSKSKQIKKVIAGCGGSEFSEIKRTLKILGSHKQITLLHGFQGYPTPLEENCLDRIKILLSLAEKMGNHIQIGFADHADPGSYDSTHLASMAVGLGATTLEKHLTLSRCLKLEDHESALSPDELKVFVDIIKRISKSKGKLSQNSPNYNLPPAEIKYREFCIRHVVSKREIKENQIISNEDVCLKRSSSIDPITNLNDVIGKKSKRIIPANQFIVSSDLVK